MPRSRLKEIEAQKNHIANLQERQERLELIRELIPNERVLKPRGSRKIINQCRILNTGNLYHTTSKTSSHRRCHFSGKQQLLTDNPDEPWVWACLKHVRYFLDTYGGITIRNSPDSEPRVLRA